MGTGLMIWISDLITYVIMGEELGFYVETVRGLHGGLIYAFTERLRLAHCGSCKSGVCWQFSLYLRYLYMFMCRWIKDLIVAAEPSALWEIFCMKGS